MRHARTKIIATLGPASFDEQVIGRLIDAGADCFRVNFSHTTGEKAGPLIAKVRRAAEQRGMFIPVLADIQGPKIRIGQMPDDGVLLEAAQHFTLTRRDIGVGSTDIVESQYAQLIDDVEVGAQILLADGTIELVVERIDGDDVLCRVINGGRLTSRKGMNLPRTKLSVETLTEKDKRDLAWIADSDVDMVAISFVRSCADINYARRLLGGAKIPVMAKLELPEVLDRLDEVLRCSDGVMIARGDLAVEVPFEQVPALQKRILQRAAARGKWAIVATQMLGSMVKNPRPSRAEVSDVANAVVDGTDAIMLSEESATGDYPIQAVDAMNRIAIAAEGMVDRATMTAFEDDIQSFAAGAANAAVGAARRLRAKAIVALAGSGLTALAISKWRPEYPVLALSAHVPTLRRLNVLRGVTPVALEQMLQMEQQIQASDRYLLDRGWARPGDVVVVVAAVPLGQEKATNTIRFHHVRQWDTPAS